jgi:hypothetical protein
MINKIELQSVINKYYLNGLIEAVKWDVKDDNLNIKFTAPTREMIGEISHNNFKLEDSSFGISNTSQLLKLINITTNEVILSFIKNNKIFNKLIIADQQFTVNYSLADILTIPKTGAYNGSEEWDIEIDLESEVVVALIKAKSALPESTTVIINPYKSLDGDPQLELTFGGDIEYANKVSYYLNINKNTNKDFELAFNSDLLKEILSCNKEYTSAKMSVNLEGLIKLEFKTDKTTSTYYIVKKDV